MRKIYALGLIMLVVGLFPLTTQAAANNKTLTITKAGTGAGTVTTNDSHINCGSTCFYGSYANGASVTLTASATAGSTFAGWSGDCSGTSATCTLSITGVGNNVTATFNTSTFGLIVSKFGTGSGTVTSDTGGINCGATCSANYNSGTIVTLTAAATSGSTFTGWSGACTNSSGTCVVTMSAAKNVTANFSLNTFALNVSTSGSGTVTSDVGGINCPGTCTQSYGTGTSVTLTATPNSGYTFSGWSGACSGSGTCVLSMTAAKSVTATFSPIIHTLSVTSGAGGTVTSDTGGVNCGVTCTVNYNEGTVVTLTATPDTGYFFNGWSGACTNSSGTCVVTMSANKSVTATYAHITYVLGVTNNGGGTVTSDVGGINCGATCSQTYNSGTVVTLTAAPTIGFSFTGWSGDCSGTGTCVVTMSAAKNVTATFTLNIIIIPPGNTHRTLAVTKSGAGTGLVVSDDSQINCGATCSQNGYNGSDNVTLSATADAGSTFIGWSGDCTGLTCSLHMSQDRNVTANFDVSGAPLSPNPITNAATSITTSDAVLNATNGQLDATGHSFWVSTNSPIDTSTPNIPAGVYSSPDLGAISANANFSYNLSDITTHGVPGNLPAITPNTHYYFVAWALVGGTWYPGQQLDFTTSAAAPTTVTVTIAKYINGSHATAKNTGSASFPMESTWAADNIGSGTGTYSLATTGFNNPNAYEATTSEMSSGANYSTHETASNQCTSDFPFKLDGYSTGTSLAGAEEATQSKDTPSLTGITQNEYIIVWNKTCPPAPTHLSPADNSTMTSADLTQIDWTDVTDPAPPITYYYESSNTPAINGDGSFVSPIYVSGELSESDISAAGTPNGVYYWHVRAKDSAGNYSAWTSAWKITVADAPVKITGTISGQKFLDANANGKRDDGEDTISNWPITLWQSSGEVTNDVSGGPDGMTIVDSTTTNSDGNYSFSGLPNGDYVVCEDLSGPAQVVLDLAVLSNSPSWFQSFPTKGVNCGDNGLGYSITIDTSTTDTASFAGIDFGNYQQGSISGLKFNDSNQDGIYNPDNNEFGLSGWTIQLYGSTGTNLIDSTTTGEDGTYSFNGLTPGTYMLKEVNQTGWVASVPVDPASFTVNVTSGNDASDYNFGNHFNGSGGGGGGGGGLAPADNGGGGGGNGGSGNGGNDNGGNGGGGVTVPAGQVLGDSTGTGTGGTGDNGNIGTGGTSPATGGNGTGGNGPTGQVLGASTTNPQVAQGDNNGQVEGANTGNGNQNSNSGTNNHPKKNYSWLWWLLLILILIALYLWWRNRNRGNGPTA